MLSDPIADYLTRIRNGIMASKPVIAIPSSKIKKEITKVLKQQGYILDYKVEKESFKETIKIALKYHGSNQEPVIRKIERISKPGLRRYASCKEIPRVLNGLGVAILSTSKGVMTGNAARREKLGGEVLCFVH